MCKRSYCCTCVSYYFPDTQHRRHTCLASPLDSDGRRVYSSERFIRNTTSAIVGKKLSVVDSRSVDVGMEYIYTDGEKRQSCVGRDGFWTSVKRASRIRLSIRSISLTHSRGTVRSKNITPHVLGRENCQQQHTARESANVAFDRISV
jgi:hypothetical protein